MLVVSSKLYWKTKFLSCYAFVQFDDVIKLRRDQYGVIPGHSRIFFFSEIKKRKLIFINTSFPFLIFFVSIFLFCLC